MKVSALMLVRRDGTARLAAERSRMPVSHQTCSACGQFDWCAYDIGRDENYCSDECRQRKKGNRPDK